MPGGSPALRQQRRTARSQHSGGGTKATAQGKRAGETPAVRKERKQQERKSLTSEDVSYVKYTATLNAREPHWMRRAAVRKQRRRSKEPARWRRYESNGEGQRSRRDAGGTKGKSLRSEDPPRRAGLSYIT